METIVQNEEGTEESNVTWNMVEASGEQWRINSEGEKESLEELLVSDASCFESDQVNIYIAQTLIIYPIKIQSLVFSNVYTKKIKFFMIYGK